MRRAESPLKNRISYFYTNIAEIVFLSSKIEYFLFAKSTFVQIQLKTARNVV